MERTVRLKPVGKLKFVQAAVGERNYSVHFVDEAGREGTPFPWEDAKLILKAYTELITSVAVELEPGRIGCPIWWEKHKHEFGYTKEDEKLEKVDNEKELKKVESQIRKTKKELSGVTDEAEKLIIGEKLKELEKQRKQLKK